MTDPALDKLVEQLRYGAKEPCGGCCYGEDMEAAADVIEEQRAAIQRLTERAESAEAERDQLQVDLHNALETAVNVHEFHVGFWKIVQKKLPETEKDCDRLRALLDGRDKFIVDHDLWGEFVASLARTALTGEVK